MCHCQKFTMIWLKLWLWILLLQLCCSGTTYQMFLSLNSSYFYSINCGCWSKMVLYDYCTFLCMNFFRPMREYFLGYSASKFRGKDKLFSTSPFGNVVPCAASRLLVSILFYTAPILKLHCKINIGYQNIFLPCTLCNKYFSELSLKITHNNN